MTQKNPTCCSENPAGLLLPMETLSAIYRRSAHVVAVTFREKKINPPIFMGIFHLFCFSKEIGDLKGSVRRNFRKCSNIIKLRF